MEKMLKEVSSGTRVAILAGVVASIALAALLLGGAGSPAIWACAVGEHPVWVTGGGWGCEVQSAVDGGLTAKTVGGAAVVSGGSLEARDAGLKVGPNFEVTAAGAVTAASVSAAVVSGGSLEARDAGLKVGPNFTVTAAGAVTAASVSAPGISAAGVAVDGGITGATVAAGTTVTAGTGFTVGASPGATTHTVTFAAGLPDGGPCAVTFTAGILTATTCY